MMLLKLSQNLKFLSFLYIYVAEGKHEWMYGSIYEWYCYVSIIMIIIANINCIFLLTKLHIQQLMECSSVS